MIILVTPARAATSSRLVAAKPPARNARAAAPTSWARRSSLRSRRRLACWAGAPSPAGVSAFICHNRSICYFRLYTLAYTPQSIRIGAQPLMVHDGQRTEDHRRRHGRTLAGVLWFPAFFFFGFLLCYLLPFHSLTPHHVEVAVSPPAAARSLSRDFAARAPGSFDLVTAPDAAAVRALVTDRRVVAGYSATGTGGDLYVAQAGGAQLEQIVSR